MISKRKKKLAAAFLLVAAFYACAAPGKRAETPIIKIAKKPIEVMFKQAESAKKQRQMKRELDIYRAITKYYPKDEGSAAAYYQLGKNRFNFRKYKLSMEYFGKVVTLFPGSDYFLESYISMGISRVYLKMRDKAESTLESALSKNISSDQRSTVLYHLGENEYLSGRYGPAAKWFIECWEDGGTFKAQANRRIRQIVHNFLSEKKLLQISEKYKSRFPADIALLELSQIYQRNGKELDMERILERLYDEFPGGEKPDYFISRGRRGDVITIGSVLPLSGKDAQTGAKALKGIQLAFSVNRQLVEKKKIRLVIKDSASEPNTARAAVAELGEDESIVGVIGPFGAETLEAALDVARQNQIPIITPVKITSPSSIQDEGTILFRTGTTAAAQGRMLGKLSVEKLGYYRLAVLYPDNEYGRELMNSYTTTVELLGADVKEIQSYDPTATDFGEQIKALGGMEDSELRNLIYNYATEKETLTLEEINEELEILYQGSLATPYISKLKELPLTRDNFSTSLKINYDAIFIPGDYDRAGLILPALTFYNITGIQIIGSDRYASKELVRIGEKYTEGVLFAGEFFADSDRVLVKNFVSSFENAFGEKPGINAARSYDAVNLVLSLIEAGVEDKEALVKSLNKLESLEGVGGELGIGPNGVLENKPFILTIQRGKITEFQMPYYMLEERS